MKNEANNAVILWHWQHAVKAHPQSEKRGVTSGFFKFLLKNSLIRIKLNLAQSE